LRNPGSKAKPDRDRGMEVEIAHASLYPSLMTTHYSWGQIVMNKWRVQPQHWQYLTHRQHKRMFKMGSRMAGSLLVVMVVFSLLVEAALGL